MGQLRCIWEASRTAARLVPLELVPLEKDTGQKGGCSTEKPLNTPDLDGLPIEDRICAEDEPDQYRR
jgi:hypothetical protein